MKKMLSTAYAQLEDDLRRFLVDHPEFAHTGIFVEVTLSAGTRAKHAFSPELLAELLDNKFSMLIPIANGNGKATPKKKPAARDVVEANGAVVN